MFGMYFYKAACFLSAHTQWFDFHFFWLCIDNRFNLLYKCRGYKFNQTPHFEHLRQKGQIIWSETYTTSSIPF